MLLRITLKVMSMDVLQALIVMDQSQMLQTASLLIMDGIDMIILLESSAVSKHAWYMQWKALIFIHNVMLVVHVTSLAINLSYLNSSL